MQGSVEQNSCVNDRLSRDRLRLVLKMTCVPRGQSEQQRSVWWELDKERGQQELKGRTALKSGVGCLQDGVGFAEGNSSFLLVFMLTVSGSPPCSPMLTVSILSVLPPLLKKRACSVALACLELAL